MVEINLKRTKIVHLQYGSSSSGNYTIRQHEAFITAGIDSSVLSLHSEIHGDPKIQSLGKTAKLISRLNQKIQNFVIKKRNKKYGGFSASFIGSDISSHPLVKEADFIYVHWVLGGFLSVRNLEQIAELGKPVLIIMHDMWAITGGCSHSFECGKFNDRCHNCPILHGDKDYDLSAKQFDRKKLFYQKFDNLYFISPSKWLYNLAKDAALTKDKPVFHIPNIIDSSLFKPFDKKTAKGILNLGEDNYVIAFGANRINSPYKGWKYLQKALLRLKEMNDIPNIEVLVFGSAHSAEIQDAIPFKTTFMGFIQEDSTTNLIYNASDVFVVPSLADNLPTTILESLSCGTAVVGFDVGGIPDMIVHKENGYLSRYKDEDDLAKGIIYCLKNSIEGKLPNQFSSERIMQSHLDLFSFIKNRD